jgi:UDP-N-acetylmuramoyl-L-alanine---L-glutamate ligase
LPKAPTTVSDLAGQNVLIVGVGREGTALASRLGSLHPAPGVVALEGREGPSAQAFRENFPEIPLHLMETPGHIPSPARESSIAVVSPGVAITSELHRALQDLSIPLTSGSALAVAEHRDRMVGITGSKGKSTTTTLVHALLEGLGRDVALGGNMGIPLMGLPPADFYAVELSSFQCHYLEASPRVVGLTALFPEHLDWHGDVDTYYRDKLSLVAHNPEHVVANAEDPILRRELEKRYPGAPLTWVGPGHQWHLEPDGEHFWLQRGDQKLFHTAHSRLLGHHNHQNMLMALAIADATGLLEGSAVESVLSGFEGLAHRLERIDDPSGVVFVNDSLATNPQAGAAALRSLSSPGMVWIVGGQDRGVDYQPLVDQVVASKPRHILGLPASGHTLLGLFRDGLAHAGAADDVLLEDVADMESALRRARELAQPGDYVLLSPAAPSFGQYRDYQHRAEDFRLWIENTRKEHS